MSKFLYKGKSLSLEKIDPDYPNVLLEDRNWASLRQEIIRQIVYSEKFTSEEIEDVHHMNKNELMNCVRKSNINGSITLDINIRPLLFMRLSESPIHLKLEGHELQIIKIYGNLEFSYDPDAGIRVSFSVNLFDESIEQLKNFLKKICIPLEYVNSALQMSSPIVTVPYGYEKSLMQNHFIDTGELWKLIDSSSESILDTHNPQMKGTYRVETPFNKIINRK